MRKSVRPIRPRRPTAARRAARGKTLARRGTPEPRLLDRILDTPRLAQVTPRIAPELLHRIIERCGLEDCGALVALATPGQLMRIFDLDLWPSDGPGHDEQFDAHRFGVWLEALMESGAAIAADRIANLDADFAIGAVAQHVRVFDIAATSSFTTMDAYATGPSRGSSGGAGCEIGGYLIEPIRSDSWDAIVGLLVALDADHRDYFSRLMRGCRRLSNSTPELDGCDDLLTDREQEMFERALDRERRREKQGFVTPPQARAFLQAARHLQLGRDTAPPRSPVAGAYARAVEWTAPPDLDTNDGSSHVPGAGTSPADRPDDAQAMAAVVDLLVDDGLLPSPARALLEGSERDAGPLARIEAHMRF